jgi:hypothetical protein
MNSFPFRLDVARPLSCALALSALIATLAVLSGCSQPAACSSTYRGGCVETTPPQPVPYNPPPPAAAPPQAVAPAPSSVPQGGVPLGDPARFAAMDDKQCRSYGLKFGTHDYADCRIRLSAQHRGLDPNK